QGHLSGNGTVVPNVINGGTVVANAAQPLTFGGLLVNQTSGIVSSSFGRLAVNGQFTNQGTLTMLHSVGTFNGGVVNSGAWITDPTTNVFNDTLTVTASGYIAMTNGDVFVFSNGATTAASFVNLSTNNTEYDTKPGKFLFSGTLGVTQAFYAAGHELGSAARSPTNPP